MNLAPKVREFLKRYGLALALASLALFLRGQLPLPEGTGVYQLPLAAVVLSAWYGGRGPGLFASLICATGTGYWFIPPVSTFEVSPDHVPGFSIFIAVCLFLSEFSSGRRRAEHALRASEERFHALVQFSFDVYWETDAEHRFTRQEFSERMTDAPARGSEIGKTRWEIPFVEPDEEAWRQHRATLDAHLPFRDFELARPTADGGTRYVSVSGIPAFDEIGRFVGHRGVGRHITEQKRAEAEHRSYLKFLESMDRINRAMQGTQDLQRMLSDVLLATLDIFACDRAWLIYPCDPDAPAWHAVMEHTRPQFPGAFALQAELPVDRDVAAAFAATRAAPGAVLFGPDYALKIPAMAADRFAVRSQMAMAIDAKADQPYLLGLHQCSHARLWTAEEQRLFQEIGRRLSDGISALSSLRSLRDSERKLDAAQRIAHVGWWERDFVTNRVTLSEEVQRIFGVPPVDLPYWQERWTSLIHPQDRAATAEAAAAAVRGGPRYDVEYRVVRPDGTVRVVHSQGDVVLDDSGQPLRQFGVLQDITELRQSEDELSEVKERFRVLAESSLTGIYLTEQDRFTYVNPALAQMFGYEVAEVVGRLGSTDLTCPDDRPLVAENMRRRLQGDVEEMRYEFRGLRKDGSVFPVEVHGRRIEHGGRIGVLGTLIDNTERRRAEDALRASEARFRTFVDHATDAFFLLDEQILVVDVNRQACESLGWSRDELIGMHPRDFDVGLDEPSIRRLAQRSGAGEIITFETRHRRKDGTAFPVEIRSGTFKQGHDLFYLALARDISERRQAEEALRESEQRYRTLFEKANDAIFLENERDDIIEVNERACTLLGYSRDELLRMKVPDLQAPEVRGQAGRVIRERIEKHGGASFESVDLHRSGRRIPVEVTIVGISHRGENLVLSVVRDITERKRVEAEVQARQELLDLAQEAARAVAFDWYIGTREGPDRRWSPEVEAMYGLEPGAFEGTYVAWKKLLHPDDWPAVKLAVSRALETSDVAAEYRVVHRDGSVHWLRAKGRMLFDANGQPERMVGFLSDVTDWHHAVEELRASEARFRTFVDHATDAFLLLDQQLHVVDVNRQACETLGYSREEMVGMHPRDFDAGLDEAAIARLAERAGAGERITFETRHRRKDGTAFPVEIRTGTFRQAGQLFYLALARDISERKRAEESLRQSEAYLAEAQRLSHTGSWALDLASNRYVYTSEESDRIFGFDPQGEKPSREAVFERIHPEDRSSWKRNLEKSLREKVDTFDQYRIVLPDGRVRHIHTIRHPVVNSAGEVVKLVGTSIDITERKRAEEERERLRQLETELAHMSRLTTLGELTASIAHEVNQPIGAMVTNAAACTRWLAAQPPAMTEAQAALANIVADGKRAGEVIARIRALTRRQAPRMELLDVNHKVREVLALAEHELKTHDIVLRTEFAPTLPSVTGDRVQLQQVLLNLLVNAIEAMSGVHDRARALTIVTAAQKPGAVVVEVRDSGPGLDEEGAERVFEPFYTTKAQGIGIGLSISRSIVEAHGGRLWASANEPHGAVFRFSLPVAGEGQA